MEHQRERKHLCARVGSRKLRPVLSVPEIEDITLAELISEYELIQKTLKIDTDAGIYYLTKKNPSSEQVGREVELGTTTATAPGATDQLPTDLMTDQVLIKLVKQLLEIHSKQKSGQKQKADLETKLEGKADTKRKSRKHVFTKNR